MTSTTPIKAALEPDAARLLELRDEYSDYAFDVRLGKVYGTATIGEFVTLIDRARSTYASLGDGVVVPRKPTADMIGAGVEKIGGGSTFDYDDRMDIACEVYRAMIAATPAAPSQDRGGRVRALEWKNDHSDGRTADTPFGRYVALNGGLFGRPGEWNAAFAVEDGTWHKTAVEAEAACEADWLRRCTLAALEDPTPAPAAGVEEALRNIKRLIDRLPAGLTTDEMHDLIDAAITALSTLPTAKSVAAPAGEVRGPCIPVTYCGLATSVHVPVGSDEEHCDLCGHPAHPVAASAGDGMDVRRVLYDLRERAAEEARDSLAGATLNGRALSAYEWLGDEIEAFVGSLEFPPPSKTYGVCVERLTQMFYRILRDHGQEIDLRGHADQTSFVPAIYSLDYLAEEARSLATLFAHPAPASDDADRDAEIERLTRELAGWKTAWTALRDQNKIALDAAEARATTAEREGGQAS